MTDDIMVGVYAKSEDHMMRQEARCGEEGGKFTPNPCGVNHCRRSKAKAS